MTEFREKANALKEKINGRVVLPGDSDYDDIRKIWNAMIDQASRSHCAMLHIRRCSTHNCICEREQT